MVAYGFGAHIGGAEIAGKNGRAQTLQHFGKYGEGRHGLPLDGTTPDGIQRKGVTEPLHQIVHQRDGGGVQVVSFLFHGNVLCAGFCVCPWMPCSGAPVRIIQKAALTKRRLM